MALTEHEKHHLNAVITEIADNKLQSAKIVVKLSASKQVTIEGYASYLDEVKIETQKILDSGIFPIGLEPSDIHDYLEQ